jgi:hypothetical protein
MASQYALRYSDYWQIMIYGLVARMLCKLPLHFVRYKGLKLTALVTALVGSICYNGQATCKISS